MDWKKLLCRERYNKSQSEEEKDDDQRNPFQRDYDIIAFSSYFRRLQDKTQAFPLRARNDFIRTRLTHCHEVSCVGRSLGQRIGAHVLGKNPHLTKDFTVADFASIVAAACLCHDIGNPPFGHKGEAAISTWFKETEAERKKVIEQSDNSDTRKRKLDDKKEKGKQKGEEENLDQMEQDFAKFEGNAQGFRIITKLHHSPAGMRLTYATLSTFMKYPRPSHYKPTEENVMTKKFGYFKEEENAFIAVAEKTGLLHIGQGNVYCRHPLTFLVEAADDICYNIVDLEDGYRAGCIHVDDVKKKLTEIINASNEVGKTRTNYPTTPPTTPESKTSRSVGTSTEKARRNFMEDTEIEHLRGKAIGVLVTLAVNTFLSNYDAIMNGKYTKALVEEIPALKSVKEFNRVFIYSKFDILVIEASGFNVLSNLLKMCFNAILEHVRDEYFITGKSDYNATILGLIPPQFLPKKGVIEKPEEHEEEIRYKARLAATDFVAGMTDEYAVQLYQQITGISLPFKL